MHNEHSSVFSKERARPMSSFGDQISHFALLEMACLQALSCPEPPSLQQGLYISQLGTQRREFPFLVLGALCPGRESMG